FFFSAILTSAVPRRRKIPMQLLTNFKHFANPRNLAILGLLMLTGCGGGYPWHKQFWTLPKATGAEPIEGKAYPIKRAEGTDAKWPELSSIPTTRPIVPMTGQQMSDEQKQLQHDWVDSQRAAGALR